MFCCPHCGLTLTVQGTVVVACGCEKSVDSERRVRQERENFDKRPRTIDLNRRKRSNYRKD